MSNDDSKIIGLDEAFAILQLRICSGCTERGDCKINTTRDWIKRDVPCLDRVYEAMIDAQLKVLKKAGKNNSH